MTIKLKTLGANAMELNVNGQRYLFSYDTLVAAQATEKVWFQTKVKYSKTTSKHINDWLNVNGAELVQVVEPSILENMLIKGSG